MGVRGSVLSFSTPIGQEQLVLAGFSGTEEISRPFSFDLELLAENDRDVRLDRLVGQSATIQLPLGSGDPRFFNGIVQRASQGARGTRFTTYRAEVVPKFWLMTRTVNSRSFERRSVPDILRLVLGGLDVEFRLQGNFPPRDYCVQYRESDFAFASRLMEEEGIFYFFKHDSEGHTLVLGNTPDGHPDVPGAPVTFDASGSERVAQAVYTWDKTQELRSGKVVLTDYNFQLPEPVTARATIRESVTAGSVTHSLRVGGNEALEQYDYPGGYATRFDGIDAGGGEQPAELQKILIEAQRVAAIRMEEEALPSLVIRGASNCRQFASGQRFTLSQHQHASGRYVLTGVSHTARLRDAQAVDRGVTYNNHFTCIPESLSFRPRRATPKPTIAGPQPAIVVGPAGTVVHSDKYGRVKVKFLWDREGDSSCWIRVAQPHSGSGQGAFWLPEVNDEVLVAFEHGDPDRPVILGALYNTRHLPPPRETTPQ